MGILSKVFGRFLGDNIYSPSSIPKIPRKKEAVDSMCDDSVLRRLANDYEQEKTKWVFASDMAELFDFVDLHNFITADNNKIEVFVNAQINKKLETVMNTKQHECTEEEMNWDDISRIIGPASVDGIVINFGNKTYDVAYIYTGIESYLTLEMPNGNVRKHYFGIEPIENLFIPKQPTQTGPKIIH